jgi:hypothetical protein
VLDDPEVYRRLGRAGIDMIHDRMLVLYEKAMGQ